MNCGTTIKDINGVKTRINTGYFMFLLGSFELLKKSPISLIRFKIEPEANDFIIKSSLVSEEDAVTYQPANYFINFLKCIE